MCYCQLQVLKYFQIPLILDCLQFVTLWQKISYLCQAELCVEIGSVHVQIQGNRLRLCTAWGETKRKEDRKMKYNSVIQCITIDRIAADHSSKNSKDPEKRYSGRSQQAYIYIYVYITCMAAYCDQSQCHTRRPVPETGWRWPLQTGRAHTHSAAPSGTRKTRCCSRNRQQTGLDTVRSWR